ncbi:hypothetical protein JXA88_03765 [Candidatus Fermentibacteria bacterium]|nr:hypothetical protein [Candidatus Fermentibacteria bacterium]
MAGLLVAAALSLTAGTEPIYQWLLPLPWILSLIGARCAGSRGMRVACVLLGLLAATHAVERLGSSARLRHDLAAAEHRINEVAAALETLVDKEFSPSFASSRSVLDSVTSAFPGTGAVLLGADGPVAWAGEVPRSWSTPLPGRWAVAARDGCYLMRADSLQDLLLVALAPVALSARVDTVMHLGEGSTHESIYAPRGIRFFGPWALYPLVLLLMAEILGLGAQKRWALASLTILAARIGLTLAQPAGALFMPDVFAAPLFLFHSPGDALASSLSVLLLASLLRDGKGFGRWRVPLVGAATVGACSAASVLLWLWRSAAPYCTIPVAPLERIATMPEVWALVASGVSLFVAFAFFLAHAPLPLVCLGSAVGLLATMRDAAWIPSAALLLATVMLIRRQGLWPVTRATAVVIVACLAFLPQAHGLLAGMHRIEVERLADRLASDQRPWFQFLARESLRHWRAEREDLYELWRRGPFRLFPVTGQLAVLDERGFVRDRLSFGLQHRVAPIEPAQGRVMEWEDVTEMLTPPRAVINAAVTQGDRTVAVSLMADLLSSLPTGDFGTLADGTRWPGALVLSDRGLLSLQEGSGPEMGWRGRKEGTAETLRFQREFADGPHVVELSVAKPSFWAQAASFLALSGMLCLAANGVIALGRLWVTPSRHAFYRYRDRLLPLLLVVGVGPVFSLAALTPSLERAARDRDRQMETAAKARDVAGSFRLEGLRQAAELASQVGPPVATERTRASGLQLDLFSLDGVVFPPSPEGEILPPGLVRVATGGRSLFWIAGVQPLVHALVPHAQGALLVRKPIDHGLHAVLGATQDWTAVAWRKGEAIAAVLSPRAWAIPRLLPSSALHALASSAQMPVVHRRWAFAPVADDLLGESLIIGVRLDRPTHLQSQWAVFELWALGILLPLVTGTVILSSMVARWVSTPISRLTARAASVGEDAETQWPALSGELGNLSRALSDMTARLSTTTAAVAHEKAHLETVLEHIAAGVLVTDRHLSVQEANSAVQPLLPWIAPGQPRWSLAGGPLEGIVRRVMERGAPVRETLTRPEDRRIWQASAAPIGEHASGVVVVMEEATELMERQRLLTWAEFAREAAHEIKNPLTPIKLSAQHLRRAFEDGRPGFAEVLSRATEMIERQAGRMEGILKELSSFTRATGRTFQNVNLCPIVAQCVHDYSYYESKGIVVGLACRVPELVVLGDTEALRTVCVNIIDNAVKAVEGGGTVEIAVLRRGDAAVIRCDDTGPGIPPELKDRVFEPGFSRRPGGTGLGLSICRSLVAAHGGSIEITNSSSGGTRVEVVLPRRETGAPDGP